MTVDEGRRTTLAGIARKAGVSVLTVSRVLSGRSDEEPWARQRVEELLSRHGYQRVPGPPPPVRVGLIDVVFDDLAGSWPMEIIRGVESVAHPSGVGTIVSALRGRTTATGQWLRNLRARSSDGVILAAIALPTSVDAQLRRLHLPLVLVEPTGEPVPDVPVVAAANIAGGRQATEHLLSLGHRRIGFVGGPPQVTWSRACQDGYRAGLQGAGLPVHDELIQVTDRTGAGFEAAVALLRLDRPPTAIFAASDQLAFDAYQAVRHAGLRVPDEVSVVGFDDPPAARLAGPPLTAVRRPLAQMGLLAGRTVLRLRDGQRLEKPRVELATELVVRESSAAPPST